MIEANLSIFDAAVIGIMLLSCAFAFFRGFVREILSLGAWIGAGLVTIYYFPSLTERIEPQFKSPIVAAGISTLSLYIGSLIVFSILNRIILKFVKSGSDVGILDNLLGLGFGALRGAFILSLGYFLMQVAMPKEKEKQPVWIRESVTAPYLEQSAKTLADLAPNYIKDMQKLEKQAREQAGVPSKPIEERGAGYSREETEELNRVIEGERP